MRKALIGVLAIVLLLAAGLAFATLLTTSPDQTFTTASAPPPPPPPPSGGSGTTYTVKKDGTGNFTTIQACANTAQAGDTCAVYPGLYDEKVAISHSGTTGNPITFTAGSSIKPQVRAFLPTNASYITINGFEITADGMASLYDQSLYHGSILINGGTGIKITNNYVHDTYSVCIGFSNTSFLTIDSNQIDRCEISKHVLGNPGGPFDITAGVNDQVKFTLNNSTTYAITLTPGTGRTTRQICNDINAVASSPAVPGASAVQCNFLGGDGRVDIMPYDGFQGPNTSVVLDDVPNNAYATLGLTLGDEVLNGYRAGISVSTAGPASDVLIQNNHISRIGDFLNPSGQRYVYRNNILGPSEPAITNHIDGVQNNGSMSFLLIEGNESVDNHTSDNHFTLMSGSANNWIIRYNHSLRSKGSVGIGCSTTQCPGTQFSQFAVYNNTWYNNVDYYYAWNEVNFVNAGSQNVARNNVYYRSVNDPGGKPYLFDSLSTVDRDYDLVYKSGTTGEVHQVSGDPLFVDAASDNFNLQSGSPAANAGGPLTTATNAGSGSIALTVTAAYPFQPGWAGVQPDWIAVGSANNVAQIASIDYANNVITLASPLTWTAGAPVYLYKNSSGQQVLTGSAPNIGAF